MVPARTPKSEICQMAQKRFDQSFEAAERAVEEAKKAIAGHPVPQKAVIVSDDAGYRAEAYSALSDRPEYEIVTLESSEDLEVTLKGSLNIVFLLSFGAKHLDALEKNLIKKVVAVAPKGDALLQRLRDMRAVIVTSPLSPEMLRIAF